MSDWRPQSVWDRLRRTLRGWMDPADEVDEASILFNLAFIAPVFLAFVFLVRR